MSKEQEKPEDMRRLDAERERLQVMRLEELRAEIKKGLDSGSPSLWDPEEIIAAGRALRAAKRKSVCDPSLYE